MTELGYNHLGIEKIFSGKNKNLKITIDTKLQLKSQIILDLFDNKKFRI